MRGLVAMLIVAVALAVPSLVFAECAWVLWEQAEHGDPVTGRLMSDEWKPKDAHEAKRACDAALTRSATFLVQYAAENKYRAERLGNRVTHWEGGALRAVYRLQCLPNTIDPREPKSR